MLDANEFDGQLKNRNSRHLAGYTAAYDNPLRPGESWDSWAMRGRKNAKTQIENVKEELGDEAMGALADIAVDEVYKTKDLQDQPEALKQKVYQAVCSGRIDSRWEVEPGTLRRKLDRLQRGAWPVLTHLAMEMNANSARDFRETIRWFC